MSFLNGVINWKQLKLLLNSLFLVGILNAVLISSVNALPSGYLCLIPDNPFLRSLSASLSPDFPEIKQPLYHGRLKVENGYAYIQNIDYAVNSDGFFPSKIYKNLTMTFRFDVHYFSDIIKHPSLLIYQTFFSLSAKQKQVLGYILIDGNDIQLTTAQFKDLLNKERSMRESNGVIQVTYMLYQPWLMFKRNKGSCTIYITRIYGKFSLYLKNNNPNQVSCYMDEKTKTIKMKIIN